MHVPTRSLTRTSGRLAVYAKVSNKNICDEKEGRKKGRKRNVSIRNLENESAAHEEEKVRVRVPY